ncbi:MAG: hypothetical protein GX295_11930 [Syntrophomonadaceae bacterium]|jgi:type I restriction enzyme S subunit|nr:hypothetical protein [Syntrophomonadaceae bacterium]
MTKTTNIQQDTFNVPKGYKKTPLGIIPKEWEIKRFKKLFSFKNGINSGKENYGQGIKFVNTLDVLSNNFMTYDSLRGSVVVTDNQKKEFAVVKGDVLFNRTSETPEDIGHASVYVDTQNAVFGGFIIRAHSLDNSIDIDFKKYCFATPSVRKQIVAFGNGAIRYNIGQEDIAKTLIALPPLPEQQKIAEILSTWDMAIEKQNSLIEQLELRKRGLMQQLLTGKSRLRKASGERFKGEWKKARFNNVFKVINIKNFQIPKSEYKETGKHPIVDQGQKTIIAFTDSENIFKNIPVIIFGDHTRIVKWIDFNFAVGADGTQALQTNKDNNLKFLYYLLFNTEIVNLGYSRHMRELKQKYFLIPPLAEQTAIAIVLSTTDKEIEIEKQKLTTLQNQKKGLMQVLLSGKVRVKI